MDPETTNPHALRLAKRLQAGDAEDGATCWTDPVTGTSCVLQSDGLYRVLRISDGRVLPVIVGLLGQSVTIELLADPSSRRSKRAAANVISIVDEH